MKNTIQLSGRESLERFKEQYPESISTNQIKDMSEQDFVNKYHHAFGYDKRKARLVHKTATEISTKTALLWANIKFAAGESHYQNTLFNNLPQSFIDYQENIPGYDKLFGSLDFIDSDHCRSIFGPAAYFVDLMRFIDTHITKGNDIPADCQLEDRRADLSKIKLDCHNSHDLIPYIDLVINILEGFVRTEKQADAFQVTADTNYPITLPFLLPLEEIRAYLLQLKTSLHHIYKTFDNGNKTEENPITREFLELSPKAFSSIISEISRPEELSSYYGLDISLSGETSLRNVQIFMHQLGLNRTELHQLFFQDLTNTEVNAGLSRLFFINNVNDALGPILIESNDKGEEQIINLSLYKLDRIYRFLKLSKTLDWSFQDLDWAIRSLNEKYTPEKVLNLDGKNDYLACYNIAGLNSSNLTIEAWVNPNQSGEQPIIAKGQESDHQTDFMFWIDRNGHLAFYHDAVAQEYDDDEGAYTSAYTIPFGEFSHVAFSLESTQLKFYINGKLDSTQYIKQAVLTEGTDINIGRNLNDEYFDGIIKELRIWTQIKSQRSIYNHRYHRYTGKEKKLAGYWPLVESNWDIQIDQSLNRNDMTLGGEQFVMMPKWVSRDLVLDALPEPLNRTGLSFNGTDQYLRLAAINGLESNQQTIEFWIKPEILNLNQLILSFEKSYEELTSTLFSIGLNEIGHLVVEKADGSSVINFLSASPLLKNVYTHISIHYTQSEIRIYFNGAADSKHAVIDFIEPFDRSDTPEEIASVSNLIIGGDYNNTNLNYFKGQLKELSIWDYPLDFQQIESFNVLPESFKKNGVTFNGIDQYLQLEAGAGLKTIQQTIECWIKPEVIDEVQLLLRFEKNYEGLAKTFFSIFLDESGFLVAEKADYTSITSFKSTEPLSLNIETHVAVQISEYDLQISFNGILDSEHLDTNFLESFSISTDTNEVAQISSLFIGGDPENLSPSYFKGQLKTLRIWDYPFDFQQIELSIYQTISPHQQGLIAYWPLNIINDRFATDLGTNENHLNLGGEPIDYQPERTTTEILLPNPMAVTAIALNFDGEDDFVIIQNEKNKGLSQDEQFTIECWFNPSDINLLNKKQLLFSQGDAEGGLSIYLLEGTLTVYLWSANYEQAQLYEQTKEYDPTQVLDISLSTNLLNSGTWHHLVVTYDETQSEDIEIRAYLNGIPFATDPTLLANPDKLFCLSPVGAIYLGGISAEATTRFPDDITTDELPAFSGKIADLRWWNIIKSDEDILASNEERHLALSQPNENIFLYFPMTDSKDPLSYTTLGDDKTTVYNQRTIGADAHLMVGLDDIPQNKWVSNETPDTYPATALQFDGIDDYVELPNALSSDQGTIELFVNFSNFESQRILDASTDKPDDGSGDQKFFLIEIKNDELRFRMEDSDDDEYNDAEVKLSDINIKVNQWHHIAAVWNYNSAPATQLYLDGKLVAQDVHVPGLRPDFNNPFVGLQRNDYKPNNPFQGRISEVRIWNKILTEGEFNTDLSIRMNGSDPNLLHQWIFEENSKIVELIDPFNSQNNGLLGGGLISSEPGWAEVIDFPLLQNPMDQKALVFDGEREYVSGTLHRLPDLSSFTLELWVKPETLTKQPILNVQNPDVEETSFFLEMNSSGFVTILDATSEIEIVGQTPLLPNQYNHISILFEGRAFTTFLNGVADIVSHQSISFWTPGIQIGDLFKIGKNNKEGFFKGQIRMLRIWNGIKTITELQEGMYEAIDLEAAEDLVGYWTFEEKEEQAIDLTTNANHLTLGGIETDRHPVIKSDSFTWQEIDDVQKKLDTAALRFDGIDDYIKFSGFESGDLIDFTFEAWVKPSTLIGEQGLFEMNHEFTISWLNNQLGCSIQNAGLNNIFDYNFQADEWAHIAVVHNGSSNQLELYVNGSQEGEPLSVDLSQAVNKDLFWIGSTDDENWYKGLIKEVRIWNTARLESDIANLIFQKLEGTETGLLGYWPLDEGTGTIVRDRTARQKHGEFKSYISNTADPILYGPKWISPDLLASSFEKGFWNPEREALTFTNEEDNLQYHGDGSISICQRRTIELWFKIKDKNISNRPQTIYREGDDQRGLNIYVFDGELYFGGYNFPTNESYWTGSWIFTDRIISNKWHHVALVLDGRGEIRDHSLRAYLDGKLIETANGSQLFEHQESWSLGGLADQNTLFHDSNLALASQKGLDGEILELRIWNTARSSTEIQNNKYREIRGDEDYLKIWWQFSSKNGTTIPDLSFNDHDGALPSSAQLKRLGLENKHTIPISYLNENTLDEIATIKKLKTKYRLNIDHLCALWFRIKTFGAEDDRVLFDQIFNPEGSLNDRWTPYFDQVLKWDINNQRNTSEDQKIRNRLIGALKISHDDLNNIVARLSGAETLIELNEDYLSRIYRMAKIPGILRLSLFEFFLVLDMLGLEDVGSLEDFLLVANQDDWMDKTGIDIYELNFLLYDQQSEAASLNYMETDIRDMADELIRQSYDFLIINTSFASEEISEYESISIFEFLRQGYIYVDAIGAVTDHFKNLNNLQDLAQSQSWLIDFVTIIEDQDLSTNLQDKAYIDEFGLVLMEEDQFTDDKLVTLFDDLAYATPDNIEKVRQALIHRKRAQDYIANILLKSRDEHTKAILAGLSTLMDTTPDRIQVLINHFFDEMNRSEFLELILNIVEEERLDAVLTDYLYKIFKILYLVSKYDMSIEETTIFVAHPEYFSVGDILNPSIDNLDQLFIFQQLRKAFNDVDNQLIGVFEQTDSETITTQIAALSGWNEVQLSTLMEYFGSDGNYNRPEGIHLLKSAFDLTYKLGTDINFLIQLADISDLSYTFYQEKSKALLNILQANFESEKWDKVYKPIRDQLAVQKRDALLSQAIQKLSDDYEGRRSADVLYEFLLIDVQMGSETDTSLIRQGISSLQLYVQCCLMNLEEEVRPESIPMEQWQWMKNYRVWEANRKVFLYPENYIEPELRDTKSPFFQELEDELLQGEINQGSVENAYVHYLDKFTEVSSLKIVGTYLYEDNPPIQFTHALDFNGNAYIDAGQVVKASQLVDNHFTVSLWVKIPNSTSDEKGFIGQYREQSDGGCKGWYIGIDDNKFQLAIGSGDESVKLKSINNFEANHWYCISGSYDGTTARLYIDGQLEDELPLTEMKYPDSGGLFYIGAFEDHNIDDNTEYIFTGQLRDIQIWDTALEQSTIELHMKQGIGNLIPSQLVAYWKMDDGNGVEITDYSANANHLSIHDTADITWLKVKDEGAYLYSQEENPPKKTLYLIGKTKTQPHTFYYREFVDDTQWLAWKKIDLVINAEYVTPVFAFNRLFLFWAELTKINKSVENDNGEFEDKVFYNSEIKYSYYNFNKEWAVPQTYSKVDYDIEPAEHQLLKWQRLYAQQLLEFEAITPDDQITTIPEEEVNVLSINESSFIKDKPFNLSDSLEEFTISFWVKWTTLTDIDLSDVLLIDLNLDNNSRLTIKNPYALTLQIETEIESDTGETIIETTILTQSLILGDTISLSEGMWEHIALSFEYDDQTDPTSYKVIVYINGVTISSNDQTIAVSEILSGTSDQSKLSIGAQVDTSLYDNFEAHLSEFRIWSGLRSAAEITALMHTRVTQSVEQNLMYHLSLNGSNAAEEAYILDPGNDDQFYFESYPIIEVKEQEERERIILFYGDKIRTLRNGMDEQSFSITLNKPAESPNYDLTLWSSVLYLESNKTLGILDYAFDSQIQKEEADEAQDNLDYIEDELERWKYIFRKYRMHPGFWIRYMHIMVKLAKQRQAAEEALREEEEWYNDLRSKEMHLLENLPVGETALLDINNQPGRYILDTGDEQFLLTMIQGMEDIKTISQRLTFDYDNLTEADATLVQPLSLSLSEDPALEVVDEDGNMIGDNLPSFQLVRLNTTAIHELQSRLFRGGFSDMLSLKSQELKEEDFYRFAPNSNFMEGEVSGVIDFNGASGLYYREVFFHIPFLIANRLNANQQFEEAQQWYHYIFNPMAQEADEGNPVFPNDRYWQYKPFREQGLESLSAMLNNAEAIAEYKNDPFDPHAIARLRINAYQKAIVMKYIDNLLDWGDQLFRQDTGESINEAANLYVLAYDLLGDRPIAKTKQQFDEIGNFGNILIENDEGIPEFLTSLEMEESVTSISRDLVTHFKVVENEELMTYWDRVEDRLYKIRHSLNIDGVFRKLALFEPPIDPRALVNAVAGGRDIGSVLSDLNVAVPHYRYSVMLGKAKEFTMNVKELGATLLTALESKDAEQLALLENTHERNILDLMTLVKEQEIEAAEINIEALKVSKETIKERQAKFERLIDKDLSTEEIAEMVLNGTAQTLKTISVYAEAQSAVSFAIPDLLGGGAGMASPVVLTLVGGSSTGKVASKMAKISNTSADILNTAASMTAKMGGYKRRMGGWEHEKAIADFDLQEISQQIDLAKVQKKLAEQELTIHRKTIKHNRQVEQFYKSKFTNKNLYSWMVSKLSGLYFQAYKLAYDMSKSAEKAYQFEMPTNDRYVNFGHWNSMKKGLLAGESLLLDLHRMEKSHLDKYSRFQDIEKVISMATTYGDALGLLKSDGMCEFQFTEELFNRDFPGHYCRMIKSIGISFEMEEGVDVYNPIYATLVQMSNKTLIEPDEDAMRYLMGADASIQPNSSILRSNWRANQQVAISKKSKDRGILGEYALNFHFDDQYLPFEGTGALSYWRLEINNFNNPDLQVDQISNVLIHLEYTAKYDSGAYKQAVLDELE